MSDDPKPGDLRWPPPSADVEPFELLEIVRDETGRDQWRRNQQAAEIPDAYREWLPKRRGRGADVEYVEYDELDLFPSASPASDAVPELGPDLVTTPGPVFGPTPEPAAPVDPRPERTTPLPLVVAPLPRVAAPATEIVTSDPEPDPAPERAPVGLEPWPLPAKHVDAPGPPLRLSLGPAQPAPGVATASAHRNGVVTAERVGLIAAGALMGMVATLVGIRGSTFGRADTDRTTVPVTRQTTPLSPAAVVPAPTETGQVEVPAVPVATVASARPPAPRATQTAPVAPPPPPAAPPASVTRASEPAQVVPLPLPVAPPAPARVEARRASTRAAAPGGRSAAAKPARRTPVTPTAARAARLSRAPASEGPAVLGTVEQYASAWSRLDARATQALWPSVDRQALVGNFTAIREQRLTLAGCKATVVADRAAVTCRGTLRYRPRVGEHSTRTEQGRWTFDLARHNQAWLIADVGRP